MLKLMKMEVIEISDNVIIEYEYTTNRNDTITFGLDLKNKEFLDLKIEGIIGIDELEELNRLIQDNTITIYYHDYIELEEW